jgi:hypothetical protein
MVAAPEKYLWICGFPPVFVILARSQADEITET